MLIRELYENEMDGAIDLAWHVFLEFEALDYSEQGVKEFWKSIHDEAYLNQLRIYGAFEDEKILGIIATRNDGGHVALFFVDGKYQRQGIGKDLFALVCKDNTSGSITVNSSPFAVPVYHHLGFTDTDSEKVTNGLRYTPMVINLNNRL
ncbi:GNAT family N-acetyltransferase [uncultured Robinsoniella sp.]|uniref:GNAT family N-acetyltransferase n=1 Tax=uncultured Robinsoniella sp. TaxID=904190 RepID=UPI00374F6C29